MSTVKSYPSRELTRLRRDWVVRNRRIVLTAGAFFAARGSGGGVDRVLLVQLTRLVSASACFMQRFPAVFLHLLNNAMLCP